MKMTVCEAREAVIQKIGKDLSDFTEADWDAVFAHTENCLVCRRNHQVADKILDKHLKPAIRDHFAPLARVFQLKPGVGKKPKRPK